VKLGPIIVVVERGREVVVVGLVEVEVEVLGSSVDEVVGGFEVVPAWGSGVISISFGFEARLPPTPPPTAPATTINTIATKTIQNAFGARPHIRFFSGGSPASWVVVG